MMKALSLAVALGLPTMASVTPGHAQDAAGHSTGHVMPMAGQDAAGAFELGMEAMNHAMRAVPATGNPDRDFAQMMIAHHRGAIDMARTELEYGTDPDKRQLAEDVIAAQEKEIAFMESWLAKQPK